MFARTTSEPLASLVKQIDEKIANNKSLKSFVVVLTDDGDKTAGALKKLADTAKIKNVPLTLVESPAGPPDYAIAEDADVTVMMWTGGKVKVNHAFAKGKLTEESAKSVAADVSKILND